MTSICITNFPIHCGETTIVIITADLTLFMLFFILTSAFIGVSLTMVRVKPWLDKLSLVDFVVALPLDV